MTQPQQPFGHVSEPWRVQKPGESPIDIFNRLVAAEAAAQQALLEVAALRRLLTDLAREERA